MSLCTDVGASSFRSVVRRLGWFYRASRDTAAAAADNALRTVLLVYITAIIGRIFERNLWEWVVPYIIARRHFSLGDALNPKRYRCSSDWINIYYYYYSRVACVCVCVIIGRSRARACSRYVNSICVCRINHFGENPSRSRRVGGGVSERRAERQYCNVRASYLYDCFRERRR